MSILDYVRIERSGMRKEENQTISTVTDKTGEIEPHGLATKEEYVMTVKIRSSFWCNQAQFEHATRAAEKALLNEIYAPFLSIANRIRKAAYGQDEKELFKIADEIQKESGI